MFACLKYTPKVSNDSKDKQKFVWSSNVFWYVKVYIFWQFVQYTIR